LGGGLTDNQWYTASTHISRLIRLPLYRPRQKRRIDTPAAAAATAVASAADSACG